VPEDYSRYQGSPHRRHGVFVAAVGPRLLKSVDNVRVGQGVEYETKTVEVGETVDLFLGKGWNSRFFVEIRRFLWEFWGKKFLPRAKPLVP
jgi:hypothetical protein